MKFTNPKNQKIVDHLISMADKQYEKALKELEKKCREEHAIKRFEKAWLYAQLAMKFAKKELKMRRWHHDYTSVEALIDDIDGRGIRKGIFDSFND